MQFLRHGRLGDDWPNSQRYNWILFRYGTLSLESFLNEVQFGINAWIQGQGRFFPINVLTESLFFTLFRSDVSRNLVHLIIYSIFLATWSRIIWKFTANYRVLAFFVLAVIGTTRFRWDYDPHIGFGNLLPLTLIFVAVSILLLIRAVEVNSILGRITFSVLASISFVLSLMTYEISIYILPSLLISILAYRIDKEFKPREVLRRFIICTPSILCSLFYVYFVFRVLRTEARATGAYVVGFDLIHSTRVFIYNLLAPIPLLTMDISKLQNIPDSLYGLGVIAIGSVGVYCLAKVILGEKYWRVSGQQFQRKFGYYSKNFYLDIASYSLPVSMIAAPALMLSIQPAWWNKITWGNSYLGILMQELGVAVFLSMLFARKIEWSDIRFKQNIHITKTEKKRIIPIGKQTSVTLLTWVLCVSSIVNFVNNMNLGEASHSRQPYSKIWQSVISEGSFFANVNSRDIFLSETYNDAYDINAMDLYARTGIRLAGIVPPSYLWENYESCKDFFSIDCSLTEVVSKAQKTIGNGARGVLITNGSRATYPKDYGLLKINQFVQWIKNGTEEKVTPELTDWPTEMAKPNALDRSRTWYFNMFLLTPDVGIIYLFPMIEREGLKLDLLNGKIYEVSLREGLLYKPALNDKCLASLQTSVEATTEYGSTFITKWGIRTNTYLPNEVIHPRQLKWGVC
jgi:hypothetical protein